MIQHRNARQDPGLQQQLLDEEAEKRRKRRKRKQACCDGNQTIGIMILIFLAIIMIFIAIVVISVYGPAGKVNKMIDTAYVMVNNVNNSQLTLIAEQIGLQWQANNMTDKSLQLLFNAFVASDTVFAAVASIEPLIAQDLANRTAITISGFLELADDIIKNKGLNVNIPLG